MSVHALIPAAGRGARFGSLKQYVPIAGRPMLWHAVRAVCVPPVESVFVVLSAEDRAFARQDWSAFEGTLQPLYCGGETRRDSVYNALVAVTASVEADDWMLVHDAARPCLPRGDLDKLLSELADDEVGGILGLPVSETVKRVADGKIDSTVDRSRLWLAQTPQMFRTGLLMQALSRAKGAPTDEASAIEALGLKPRVVAGSRDNFKVTWPADLPIAEAILRARQ